MHARVHVRRKTGSFVAVMQWIVAKWSFVTDLFFTWQSIPSTIAIQHHGYDCDIDRLSLVWNCSECRSNCVSSSAFVRTCQPNERAAFLASVAELGIVQVNDEPSRGVWSGRVQIVTERISPAEEQSLPLPLLDPASS